jgi:5-(carboxyamino)imidazole ribonucleotide synthase
VAASLAGCWPWPRPDSGYRTVILDPASEAPAAQVANNQIVAAYDDPAALTQLADLCDVVTYEFENVPVEGR